MSKAVFVSNKDYDKFINNPNGVIIDSVCCSPIAVKIDGAPEHIIERDIIHDKIMLAYCKLTSAAHGVPTSTDIDLLKLEVNSVIEILRELLDD